MTGPLYDPPRPRAIATAAHKPDTGGPLFDADQAGAELHHPKQGGDAKAKKSEKGDKGQKEQGKKKKMSGGSSFADLKMLRNVSGVCGHC